MELRGFPVVVWDAERDLAQLPEPILPVRGEDILRRLVVCGELKLGRRLLVAALVRVGDNPGLQFCHGIAELLNVHLRAGPYADRVEVRGPIFEAQEIAVQVQHDCAFHDDDARVQLADPGSQVRELAGRFAAQVLRRGLDHLDAGEPQLVLGHATEIGGDVVLELSLDLEEGLAACDHVAERSTVLFQALDGVTAQFEFELRFESLAF